MWPIRMDMSWDECRQCLRCLELDAYGNMVSVLRAQGPFTEDKKKLLEELAKVLHITNERHRAEVRRAVNDEKLSSIAEQLNGPNTWTDWAIEGRRTIPLLPRLKSHTAFTGLANSLSLVIAAANEKKIPINEQSQQQQESIVKAEASTLCKEIIADERPLKSCSVSNYQGITRGRKRKRSSPDTGAIARNIKQNINRKLNNDDSGVNSVNIQRQEALTAVPRPLNSLTKMGNDSSAEKSRCFDKSLMKNSITCTVSPIESTNWDDSINSISSITCHDNAIAQSKINVSSNTDVQLELVKRLSCEIDELDAVDPQRNSDTNNYEFHSILNDDSNTLTCENTLLSPSEVDRISSPALSQPPSPIATVDTTQTVTINSDSTSSSGPGPPITNSSSLIYNNLLLETLNHQNTSKMDITFNSNKTVNIDNKTTNVILVQKGPVKNVKLSHIGKKVLAKIHSNNGGQIVNMSTLNSCCIDDIDVARTNSKVNDKVVFNVGQNVSEDTKSLTINSEFAIDIFNSGTKTVLSNIDAHNLVSYSNEDCSSNLAQHVDVINADKNVTDDENGDSSEINLNESLEIESTLEVPEQLECKEILINSEPHVLIDGETEIYNFESTDENICEIQIEDGAVEECSSEIISDNINMENFNYSVDDEETVSIPEDERGHYEKFNDVSDS